MQKTIQTLSVEALEYLHAQAVLETDALISELYPCAQ